MRPLQLSPPHARSPWRVSVGTSYADIFSEVSFLKSLAFQRSDSTVLRSYSMSLMVLQRLNPANVWIGNVSKGPCAISPEWCRWGKGLELLRGGTYWEIFWWLLKALGGPDDRTETLLGFHFRPHAEWHCSTICYCLGMHLTPKAAEPNGQSESSKLWSKTNTSSPWHLVDPVLLQRQEVN